MCSRLSSSIISVRLTQPVSRDDHSIGALALIATRACFSLLPPRNSQLATRASASPPKHPSVRLDFLASHVEKEGDTNKRPQQVSRLRTNVVRLAKRRRDKLLTRVHG